MKMKISKRQVLGVVGGLMLVWYISAYVFFSAHDQVEDVNKESLPRRLGNLEGQLKYQAKLLESLQIQVQHEEKLLLQALENQKKEHAEDAIRRERFPVEHQTRKPTKPPRPTTTTTKPTSSTEHYETPGPDVICVLIMCCNRPSIKRALDKLIEKRPSAEKFPFIVSQDCDHEATANVVKSYGNKIKHFIHQPDQSSFDLTPKDRKLGEGYWRIARHYRWGLNQAFTRYNYSTVLIVEDDLEIAPDFFEYFSALRPVLHADPSLWCVSAWNDNGIDGMVEENPELLYRTDFFPGLGWMLERETWRELEPNWPITFWDDWMRKPEQRKGRSCIRPELARTYTFGRVGVSRGQFFDKFLKFIKKNEHFVKWGEKDMSYLQKEKYDVSFIKMVYGCPELSQQQVMNNERAGEKCVRVQYNSRDAFRSAAKVFRIMEDIKAGVPRAAYRGVISFMHNKRRVYLAPPPDWKGYDLSWS